MNGQWELSFSYMPPGGLTIGSRYVQVYSDRRLQWRDMTRDVRQRGAGLNIGVPRCQDSGELPADELDSVRGIVRALYGLELADQGGGLGSVTLILTVTRSGRRYVAGMAHYVPTDENLDLRLKRIDSILGSYMCPVPSQKPQT
jgi:hypothetical protein